MNNIEALLTKKNITYSELAEKVGVSAAYLNMIANEKRTNPSLEVMKKIAEALGTKVEKVFNLNYREE